MIFAEQGTASGVTGKQKLLGRFAKSVFVHLGLEHDEGIAILLAEYLFGQH